jgi:diguanylate cyclase (GGDEF)-like protein
VEKTSFATPNGLLNISVSIGVAERTSGQLHWEEILAISDSALYKAKAEGRNRVVMGTA